MTTDKEPMVMTLLQRGLLALAIVILVAGSSVHAKTFSGFVVDHLDMPLADITVNLYGTRDDALPGRPHLAWGTTDAEGRFAVDASVESAELLVLEGPQGIGRIRIGKETSTDPRITYPVETTIILLHDNDQHFNFNHMDQFTAEIEDIRNTYPNVFLLNAGDIFIRKPDQWNEPTKDFYAHQAMRAIDLMNQLNYDAMTLGNHDLNYIDSLTRNALDKARFPLLGANIYVSTSYLPKPLPYTVLTTDNDISIAVLGLSSLNFKQKGVGSSRSFIKTAQNYYRYLADRHEVFVALTHIGDTRDRRLAKEIGGIHIIIGAHSHTLLTEAELVNGVLIAQAGGTPPYRSNPVDPQRPKYLGKIIIKMENERVVTKEGMVLTFFPDEPGSSQEFATEPPAKANIRP
jgi:hypothetical protein